MAAIYQRARPARFDEVVGQDHVTALLVAAVRRGMVGHAYLFSGPRGVGKTTSARLLAMAVNCDADLEERPCAACDSCRAVRDGSHPDVIELDAASNNSVEDVRELREQVRLAPLRGGRRVWVLDEAHMLSRAAANALLKTLEEPPPGLLFVLATTEPEKLPPTIASRCQHFRFRRLTDAEIRSKLERLLAGTAITADDEALDLVARAADGAMRDAESMLERLLASGEALTLAAVEAALGLPARERLWRLASALADDDLAAALQGAAALYADGFAPRTLAEQLGRTVRDLLVARVRGIALPTAAPAPPALLDEAALVRALHVLDDAQERFVRRGDLYALEVTLLRTAAAMRPPPVARAVAGQADAPAADARAADAPAADAPVATRGDALLGAEPSARVVAEAAEPATVPATPPTPPAHDRASAAPKPAPAAGPDVAPDEFDPNRRPARAARSATTSTRRRSDADARKLSWHAILSRAGPQLKAFLLPADARLEGDRLEIRYDERHAFHFGQLQRRERDFLDLLDDVGGAHLHLRVEGPGGRIQRAGGGAAQRDAGGSPSTEAAVPTRTPAATGDPALAAAAVPSDDPPVAPPDPTRAADRPDPEAAGKA